MGPHTHLMPAPCPPPLSPAFPPRPLSHTHLNPLPLPPPPSPPPLPPSESGFLTSLASFLRGLGEVRDLADLGRRGLLSATAAACSCVAALAQDCEENQQRFVAAHEDLAPALFRLITVEGREEGTGVGAQGTRPGEGGWGGMAGGRA